MCVCWFANTFEHLVAVGIRAAGCEYGQPTPTSTTIVRAAPDWATLVVYAIATSCIGVPHVNTLVGIFICIQPILGTILEHQCTTNTCICSCTYENDTGSTVYCTLHVRQHSRRLDKLCLTAWYVGSSYGQNNRLQRCNLKDVLILSFPFKKELKYELVVCIHERWHYLYHIMHHSESRVQQCHDIDQEIESEAVLKYTASSCMLRYSLIQHM